MSKLMLLVGSAIVLLWVINVEVKYYNKYIKRTHALGMASCK